MPACGATGSVYYAGPRVTCLRCLAVLRSEERRKLTEGHPPASSDSISPDPPQGEKAPAAIPPAAGAAQWSPWTGLAVSLALGAALWAVLLRSLL